MDEMTIGVLIVLGFLGGIAAIAVMVWAGTRVWRLLTDGRLPCRFGSHDWYGATSHSLNPARAQAVVLERADLLTKRERSCRCSRCGAREEDTDSSSHQWVGCTCQNCKLVRSDGQHDFSPCRCTRCKLEQHEWNDEGICSVCRHDTTGPRDEQLVGLQGGGASVWIRNGGEFDFSFKSWSGEACRIKGDWITMETNDDLFGIHYRFYVSAKGESFRDETYARNEKDLVQYVRHRLAR